MLSKINAIAIIMLSITILFALADNSKLVSKISNLEQIMFDAGMWPAGKAIPQDIGEKLK